MIPAGNSARTSSTCCSLLVSLLHVLPPLSLTPRRSSPAALIVFLIRTRQDGIMYTSNYSDTSATRDTPPPQTRHPDFIIVSVSSVILINLFLRDAPLNLFACKFVRPFLSRTEKFPTPCGDGDVAQNCGNYTDLIFSKVTL